MEHTGIGDACDVIREWNESFLAAPGGAGRPGSDLVEAVATLKRYLEREKADGKPIRELEIAEHWLMTREGVRWVMPFVLGADSMEAARRRKMLR